MKKSNRIGYRGESWKTLNELISSGKYSRDKIFNDWLDLILASGLALRDNIQRKGLKIDLLKMDGVYEDRYMEIVQSYDNSGEKGKRPVDCFAAAYHFLMKEIEETDKDCLGDIFMSEITFGEHGQFFTPEHITEMMAIMTVPSKSEKGRYVVCDPCCGSGRMLMSAHKNNPEAFLVGIDLDPRCAKICAINLMLRNLSGDVYWGNSLTAEMETVWMVRGGFIEEKAKPEAPDKIKEQTQEQIAA